MDSGPDPVNQIPSRLLQVTFFDWMANRFAIRQNGAQWSPKPRKGIPEGYPVETIFKRSGQTNGNVKMIPRSLLRNTLRAMFFNVLLGATFSQFLADLISKGGLGERTHELLFGYFFNPASFGGLREAWGRQNTPEEHWNDSKIDYKVANKGAESTSQRPVNAANHTRNKSIDRSIDPGTVAHLPHAVGYVYLYIYIYIQKPTYIFTDTLEMWGTHLQGALICICCLLYRDVGGMRRTLSESFHIYIYMCVPLLVRSVESMKRLLRGAWEQIARFKWPIA